MSTKHHRIVMDIECLDEQGTKQAVERIQGWLAARNTHTYGFTVKEVRPARADLSDCSIEVMHELLTYEIERVFMSPSIAEFRNMRLSKWLEQLQALAKCIGLNWQETVLKRTSEFERKRLLERLAAEREDTSVE